jgi:tRNA1(Val) A37 N6-methylase TrmN6
MSTPTRENIPAALPEWTEDGFLDGRLRLFQPRAGHRAGSEAVLLAAAVDPPAGADVLEVGCGSGAASLCLGWRRPDLALVGLELQAELAELARSNARRNGLETRLTICCGDLRQPPPPLRPASFDAVFANPPFFAPAAAQLAPQRMRALARAECGASLADWIAFSLRMLRPRGTLTLIHRAARLDDLLAALNGRAGDLTVFPLWPMAGRPAKHIILRARKDSRGPLQLTPGLVLHEPDGRFTAAASRLLRTGAALAL